MISRYKSLGFFGRGEQQSFNAGPRTAEAADQGSSNSSLASILEPQLSPEHLAAEFDQMCETPFVMDVMPKTADNCLMNQFLTDVEQITL